MKELQRKQRIRRLVYSYPSLFLLALVAFLLAKSAFGVLVKERESVRVVKELEEKVMAEEQRESELEAAIARLQTEEGLVEEIKEKFSVTREGEHVAIIVDERSKAAAPEVSGAAARLQEFWQDFLGLWRDD